jgi:hypothetical protein
VREQEEDEGSGQMVIKRGLVGWAWETGAGGLDDGGQCGRASPTSGTIKSSHSRINERVQEPWSWNGCHWNVSPPSRSTCFFYTLGPGVGVVCNCISAGHHRPALHLVHAHMQAMSSTRSLHACADDATAVQKHWPRRRPFPTCEDPSHLPPSQFIQNMKRATFRCGPGGWGVHGLSRHACGTIGPSGRGSSPWHGRGLFFSMRHDVLSKSPTGHPCS